MVEVSDNILGVLEMLRDFDYILISPQLNIITGNNLVADSFGSYFNVFCIHKTKHEILNKLNIDINQDVR